MNIRSMLWRLVYAVILVIIVVFCVPLLFELVGLSLPGGPAVALLKFAFAALIVLYVFFGKEPPAPF